MASCSICLKHREHTIKASRINLSEMNFLSCVPRRQSGRCRPEKKALSNKRSVFFCILILPVCLRNNQVKFRADAAKTTSPVDILDTDQPLLLTDISKLRTREIKRRLTRKHGYSAEDVAQMIDKKDLIETLAFEEHKEFQKRQEHKKRGNLKRSVMVALVAVIVIMFRPVIQRVWEIVSVNFVVYIGEMRYCRMFCFRWQL